MVYYGEFLKTWSSRSNSVKIQMRPFDWFLNIVLSQKDIIVVYHISEKDGKDSGKQLQNVTYLFYFSENSYEVEACQLFEVVEWPSATG